jgi:imidazolonepropionase-like amidohydrolase
MASLRLSTLLGQAALLGLAFAGDPATRGRTFLVHNVRVFDGSHMIRGNSVLVKDGRIAQVGDNLRAEAGTPEVDGKGGTLLPGLIDTHVHSYVRPALQQELMFGITTELDMMDPPSFAVPIRKAQAEGRENGIADIFTAGWAATFLGAHGTEGGAKIPTITAPDQAEEFVRARIAEGSDYIKIIYSSGGPPRSISKETMVALVQAAHKFGKMAVAHALTYQAAKDVINAGADGLAHIFADRSPEAGFADESRGAPYVRDSYSHDDRLG